MEILRPKNVATTVAFPLVSAGGTDFRASLTFQSADSMLSLNNAALVTASSLPSGKGGGMYILPITQNQMNNDTIDIKIIDAAGGPTWEDQFLKIQTGFAVSAIMDNAFQNSNLVTAADLQLHTVAELSAIISDRFQNSSLVTAAAVATAAVSAMVQNAITLYDVASASDAANLTTAAHTPMWTTAAQQFNTVTANAVTTAALSATIQNVLETYNVASAADAAGLTTAAHTPMWTTAAQQFNTVTANAVTTAALSATIMNVFQAFDPVTAAEPNLSVNVSAIAGVKAAADNLEILMDGNEGFYTAYAGPRGPGVYINDTSGNTNKASGVDGTISNPVSTIADAKIIADNLSIDRFYLVNNTKITLAATMTEYEFVGLGDASVQLVNMGGQIVNQCGFYNLTLEGDVNASSGRSYAENCILADEAGAATSTFHLYAVYCGFLDSFRLTSNDDHVFENCYSMVAGNGTPVIDINNAANVDLMLRHYSGGIEFQNAASTTVASVETDGQVIINANCDTGFALTVRGMASITDSAGLTSLTRDAVYNQTQVKAYVSGALQDAAVVTAAGGIARVSAVASAAIGRTALTTAAYRQAAGTVYRISYASARNQEQQEEAVTSRSLLGAVAKLVNKVAVSGTDLEVFHADDTTNFFDQSITQTSASAAIIGLDTEP